MSRAGVANPWGRAVCLCAVLCAPGCLTGGTANVEAEDAAPSGRGPGPAWIHSEQNLFVQEVWQDGMPSYLVASLRPDDVAVEVTGGAKVPASSWPVKAKGMTRIAVPGAAPPTDAGGEPATFAFALADGTALGTLHAPQAPRPPLGGAVAYTQGLNGIGAALGWAGIGASSDGLPVPPGGRGRLRLIVAKGAGTIVFGPSVPAEAPQLPEARVVDAVSSTLAITKKGGVITVVNPATTGTLLDASQRELVDLTFAVAADARAPMAELHGRVVLPTWSTALSYGVPVGP